MAREKVEVCTVPRSGWECAQGTRNEHSLGDGAKIVL